MKRIFLLLTLSFAGTVISPGAERPNIILMLANDLGYGDLPAFGATDLETPHLDRIAAEG